MSEALSAACEYRRAIAANACLSRSDWKAQRAPLRYGTPMHAARTQSFAWFVVGGKHVRAPDDGESLVLMRLSRRFRTKKTTQLSKL